MLSYPHVLVPFLETTQAFAMQLDSGTKLDSVAVALVLDKSGSMVVLAVVSAGSSLPAAARGPALTRLCSRRKRWCPVAPVGHPSDLQSMWSGDRCHCAVMARLRDPEGAGE